MRLLPRITLLCLPLASSVLLAQTPGTGLYAFGSFDNKGFDSVNLGNFNVHFSVPVISKPGRGMNFNYALVYDGLIWSPVTSGSSTSWQPDANWGFHGELNGAGLIGYMSHDSYTGVCYGPHSTLIYYGSGTGNYVYHDSFGVNHTFNYPSSSSCPVDSNGNPTNAQRNTPAMDPPPITPGTPLLAEY